MLRSPALLRRALRPAALGPRRLSTSPLVCQPAPAPSLSPAPPLLPGDSLPPSRTEARARIAEIEQQRGAPVSPFLVDSFGRPHDYLRISLTEKCNLRCTYCMPEQGVPLLPRDDLLTANEIERVAQLFVANGVKKIRLTGGEPTVRKDLIDIVSRLARLPLHSLGMTSNGIALKRKLPALVGAGLTHLNLSLDTLDPFKYELMTRRRGFSAVMESLDVARGLKKDGLTTKLNIVVIRGVNDMEVPDFVELTRENDITVRFIEYMPFEDNRWSTSKLIPSASLLSTIQSGYSSPLEKLRDDKSDTTRAYRVPGYEGSFGFISSMTDHFCGGCSRLRVGADGGVKVCLFGPPVLSLRPLLRAAPQSPESDAQLLGQIGAAVWRKKFAHNGLGAQRLRPIPPRSYIPPQPFSSRSSAAPRAPLYLPPFRLPAPLSVRAFSTSRPLPASPSSSSSCSSSSDSSASSPQHLTHIDSKTGKASMVNISSKDATRRSATAVGTIYLNQAAFDLIDFGGVDSASPATPTPSMKTKKGDVLTIAQLAGIMSSKHTSLLIPLCHPLALSHISVTLTPHYPTRSISVAATAECEGKTGVEMEALVAASTACLTVWDMCKAVAGKEMSIGGIKVVKKSGGRSGDWERVD